MYPYGYGGFIGNWLLLIAVPMIIGLWAQFRVSSAFRKWGEVRASANITGAECAREILTAANIRDVDVIEAVGGIEHAVVEIDLPAVHGDVG